MTEEVSIIAAFSAGFLSFFAPCILPLLPSYLAWLSGISLKDDSERNVQTKVFGYSIFFVLGFSLIFIILGASASFVGQIFASNRLLAQRIGGLLIIFFGLEFAGFSKIFKNYQIALVKRLFSKLSHKTSSFLIGLTFALAWVACFSPVLGAILILSSFQTTLTQGIILLSFYSLGLAIPFLLASFFLSLAIKKLKIITKITKWINLFSSLILILLGLLLFTDKFYKIVMWLTKAL